jgi:polysaccharide export outer membrane protein
MRVTRSFILLVGLALAAAGCARQPVVYIAAPAPAPQGVDNVIYGSTAPVPRPVPQYVAAPYPYAAAAYSQGRGIVAYAPAPALPPPAPVAYAAPRYAPAPVVVAAAPAAAIGEAPGAAAPVVVAAPPAGSPSGIYAYAAPVAEGLYTLDSGDRLRIVVFGQDGLTNSYSVDASGHIALPLIGEVLARGATTDQLSARIAEKLRDGFIREPHVAVEVEAYRPFFILGEVTAPGQYPFVANMSVETAVAIAGGFTPRAFRKTVTLDRIFNGRRVRITVPTTFPVRPGDTLNVQERWF